MVQIIIVIKSIENVNVKDPENGSPVLKNVLLHRVPIDLNLSGRRFYQGEIILVITIFQSADRSNDFFGHGINPYPLFAC